MECVACFKPLLCGSHTCWESLNLLSVTLVIFPVLRWASGFREISEQRIFWKDHAYSGAAGTRDASCVFLCLPHTPVVETSQTRKGFGAPTRASQRQISICFYQLLALSQNEFSFRGTSVSKGEPLGLCQSSSFRGEKSEGSTQAPPPPWPYHPHRGVPCKAPGEERRMQSLWLVGA